MSGEPSAVAELELERIRLFSTRPIAVAHGSLLRRESDFTTHDVMGVPILLSRGRGNDTAGELRAFVNVCRHRGTRLVADASGRDRLAFVCKLHGWTYDLEGHLFHVPTDTAEFVDKSKMSLGPVPVTEALGFAWVALARGASIDPVTALGERARDLEALDLGARRVLRIEMSAQNAGWKAVVERILMQATSVGARALVLLPNTVVVAQAEVAAAFHVLPTGVASCRVAGYAMVHDVRANANRDDEFVAKMLAGADENVSRDALVRQAIAAFRAELKAARDTG